LRERKVKMYLSRLCRDRYSMNAMVLLPYPSFPSPDFVPYIPDPEFKLALLVIPVPTRIIQSCLFCP